MLAEANNQPNAAFERLFLAGGVRFGDLRVAGAHPWPLTTQLCANWPDRHRCVDVLLRQAANLNFSEECQENGCGAKRQPARGYFRAKAGAGAGAAEYFSEEVPLRRIAHTAIDPRRLTVAPAQFHSLQVLEAGTLFEGLVHANPPAADTLLETLGDGLIVRVGKARTRGQGRVRLRVWAEPPLTDMRERLDGLNDTAARLPGFAGQLLFSCTLDAPALVPDRWLMANPRLEAAQIDSRLADFRLLGWASRLVQIAGWHPVAELPKSENWAIAPGSAFLYGRSCTGSADERETLAGTLLDVEAAGVGELVELGYGEATFCANLHWKRTELP
jgi:hypothetical protein